MKLPVTILVGSLKLVLLIGLAFQAVQALDRDRSITQFHHTSWTARDGAPSQITAFAQTLDGFLWIGSARGLFRFDGVTFERFAAPDGVELPSHSIYSLIATSDGGLWISFNPSGLAFFKDGELRVFSRADEIPQSHVYCFAQDLDGRIWAGTHTGIAQFDGARWVDFRSQVDLTNDRVWTMFVDGDGTLWVATDKTVIYLKRSSDTFQSTGAQVGKGVPQIAQAKDGQIWMTEYFKPTKPLILGDSDPHGTKPILPEKGIKMLFDRDGVLWMTVASSGIRRIRFPEKLGKRQGSGHPEIESFKASDGLTDDSANHLFEDREGNIWVSSGKGLDRFRYSHFVSVSLPAGYQNLTLLGGIDGDIWVASGNEKPILRIRGSLIQTSGPPMRVSSVYKDKGGTIWWGGFGGVWRQRDGAYTFLPQPEDSKQDWFWEIIPDNDDSGLWGGLGDEGLVYFRDGGWIRRAHFPGLLERVPSATYRDTTGRIWFGYTENRVYILDRTTIRSYASQDGIDIGRIRVIRGQGPQIWVGGELGLAVFSNNRFYSVVTVDGSRFGTVSGIIETSDGSLWLNTLRGIVHISPVEKQRLASDPSYHVAYETFDFADGVPGAPQMGPTVSTAVQASDGQLWFATDNGLARFDPTRVKKNHLPPPVAIRSIKADGRSYDARSSLTLPKGTTSLSINYTALSLANPERVRFRYRFGESENWTDGGAHREAFFTNLAPGRYRFQVIASNNDGIWNHDGAAIEFTILPKFYQTNWFAWLCIAATAVVAWAGYRWRIRTIKARLYSNYRERLAERKRIAQDFHDNLLQGFVSASMQLKVASDMLREDSDVKPRLAHIDNLLRTVVEQGREKVSDLRARSMEERQTLEQEISFVMKEFKESNPVDLRIVVNGESRTLKPAVHDEVYHVARESLMNAIRHADAEKIEVEISYGLDDFRLVVRDDGVGIDPEIAKQGRDGHWGLLGMKERTERIGARLKLWALPSGGTEVELKMPNHIAILNNSRR